MMRSTPPRSLLAVLLWAPGAITVCAQEETGSAEPAPSAQEAATAQEVPVVQKEAAREAVDWMSKPEIDEPVAFWIHLRQEDPCPAVPVTVREWNDYTDYIRTVYPVVEEAAFELTLFNQIVDRTLIQMRYHRNAAQVKNRARNIRKRLDDGAPWKRMVRLHTEDEQTTSEGMYGGFRRVLNRFPLENLIFEAKTGEIVGPAFTVWGAEIFQITGRRGRRGMSDEQVLCNYILLKWGMPLSKTEWPNARRRVVITSDVERFLRIIPPGMRQGTVQNFGPSDIAPMGDPEYPLRQHSCDDRFHNKRPTIGTSSRKALPGGDSDSEKRTP